MENAKSCFLLKILLLIMVSFFLLLIKLFKLYPLCKNDINSTIYLIMRANNIPDTQYTKQLDK
jgi:hypothetical protein